MSLDPAESASRIGLSPESVALVATPEMARDPRTPAQLLEAIAAARPDLRANVALNPATYPALLTWLASLDDPVVNAALAARQPPPVTPPTTPDPVPERAAVAVPSEPTPVAEGGQPAVRRRRRWIGVGVAAAVVAGAIGAGVLALRGDEAGPEATQPGVTDAYAVEPSIAWEFTAEDAHLDPEGLIGTSVDSLSGVWVTTWILNESTVLAGVDPATGSLLWTREYSREADRHLSSCGASPADGALACLEGPGQLWDFEPSGESEMVLTLIDPATGAVTSTVPTPPWTRVMDVVDGDIVVGGQVDNGALGLARLSADGTTKWTLQGQAQPGDVGDDAHLTLQVLADTVALAASISTDSAPLYAYLVADARDGSVQQEGDRGEPELLPQGLLYFPGGRDYAYAVVDSDESVLVEGRDGQVVSAVVSTAGASVPLLITDEASRETTATSVTGEELWRVPGVARRAVFLDDVVILTVSDDFEGPRELVACDMRDGSELWRISVASDASLVGTDVERVFVASPDDRRLRAFDVTTGEAVWELPTGVGAWVTVIDGRLAETYGDRGLFGPIDPQ